MEAAIKAAITEVLAELGIEPVNFTVEHPADLAHGDYATNVALAAAKQIGKAPREVAEQLRAALSDTVAGVEKIEIAGPGFINFYLKRNFFSEKIAQITAAGELWGHNTTWKEKKVIVEYTDPNPFKEFHIGHLFTNAVGESIARLFQVNGAEVKHVNYQSDVGMHVANAVYGLQALGFTADSDFTAKDMGKAYALGATALKENPAAKEQIVAINKKIYDRSDVTINALYDKGREVSLIYFETVYLTIGTTFDAYFFESEVAEKGKELVLAHPEIFSDSDGAKVFLGEQYGLHTRVFLNSEGLPTYEAKELALAKAKEDRLGAYDWSVVSTANEINEYFKVLLQAMSFIYPALAKKTEHIGHGMVRLADGKMSSRTGNVIPALTFIEEISSAARDKMTFSGSRATPELAQDIAIGAIKYVTLKGNISQDSIFDKEKALSFEGDSGPYLQYTHARICSVLEKATAAGIEADTAKAPPEPYILEKLVYHFSEVIEAALAERAPHKVTTYLTQLAGEFNTFYAQEKIADPSDQFAPYKVALSDAVRQTLKNGLWVLGIKAPERM